MAARKPPRAEEPRSYYKVEARPAPRRRATAEKRRALFDVSVLIALLDSDHVHHAQAASWLADNIGAGWASCAITQNGCVRIMSQPGYPNAIATAQVAARLREATSTSHHQFVHEDVSLLEERSFDCEQLLGHRQVTDAYLLGLASAHGLRLVTFDANVASRVVRGFDPAALVRL